MTDPTIEVVDNSDLDLTSVSLWDPVVDKQWGLSRVTNVYWEAVKNGKGPNGGDAKQLVIELLNEEPLTATDGKALAPGQHKSKVNIYATPSGGLTQDMINKKVARFQTAALAIDTPTKWGSNDQYVGKLVKAYYEAEAGKQNDGMLFQRVSRWERAS
jgi:hypothetical protein